MGMGSMNLYGIHPDLPEEARQVQRNYLPGLQARHMGADDRLRQRARPCRRNRHKISVVIGKVGQ
jgi:hypothetical protein